MEDEICSLNWASCVQMCSLGNVNYTVYIALLLNCKSFIFSPSQDTVYSKPLVCNPKEPITFSLPIRFQQIPDPVPARFTLSVKFDLMSEKRLWLNGRALNASERQLDSAFSRGRNSYDVRNASRDILGAHIKKCFFAHAEYFGFISKIPRCMVESC